MFLWLYISIGSGIALFGFTLLLKAEMVQGQRLLLARPRALLDRVIEGVVDAVGHSFNVFGAKVVRLSIHFIVHQLLGIMLSVLRFLENHISRLQWRNRIIARRIRLAETQNHLDLIAQHKEEISLSPKEKQKLKDRAISG